MKITIDTEAHYTMDEMSGEEWEAIGDEMVASARRAAAQDGQGPHDAKELIASAVKIRQAIGMHIWLASGNPWYEYDPALR